jgi:hypothetical protein
MGEGAARHPIASRPPYNNSKNGVKNEAKKSTLLQICCFVFLQQMRKRRNPYHLPSFCLLELPPMPRWVMAKKDNRPLPENY